MYSINIVVRILVVVIFVIRTIYWRITGRKAAFDKPKTRKRTYEVYLQIIARDCISIFIFIQILGWNIFPYKQYLVLELLGLFICLVAVILSYYGRKEIGANWADAAEYQIKKRHSLVTTGIYKYIRHPIYVGASLFIIGAEIVVGSWLVIPLGLLYLVSAYIRGRKEERLLSQHFGKEFLIYKKKTKMFIPYIV